jgi:hypothetical protein
LTGEAPYKPDPAKAGVREILVKQRTMLINSLRGLMAEFGIVVA